MQISRGSLVQAALLTLAHAVQAQLVPPIITGILPGSVGVEDGAKSRDLVISASPPTPVCEQPARTANDDC